MDIPQPRTGAELRAARNPLEAIDELRRELFVRKRCYQRWLNEDRMSFTEAVDRLERMVLAIEMLEEGIGQNGTEVPIQQPSRVQVDVPSTP